MSWERHVAFGWREDPLDARDWDHRATARFGVGPRPLPTARPSLLRHRAGRLEQGAAQTCVAFSITRGMDLVTRAALEIPVEAPITAPRPILFVPLASPTGIYQGALKAEHAGEDPRTAPPLEDRGCHPRLAMLATRELGFVEWDDIPYNDARVLETIPPDVWADAYDQRGLKFHRVYEDGQARIDQVAEGLRYGMAPIFGMVVDRAFTEHRGSRAVTSVVEEIEVGRHMMAVLEVEPDGTVLVDNWWGTDVGFSDGMYRIAPGLFGSRLVSDVHLLESAPAWGV